MLATQPATTPPHLHHPTPAARKPLQPRNTTTSTTRKSNNHPTKPLPPKLINNDFDNKENININTNTNLVIESIDASLAEELTAVKRKLERLKLDKDNTEKLLREKDRTLDLHFNQLRLRGELQKELEIEVDRLYRLKQLKFPSMRLSPIRSLRDKEMEKKNKEAHIDPTIGEKSGERKELKDECSTTGSPIMSVESSSSGSASSKSGGTWRIVLPVPLRMSLFESDDIEDK